MYSSRGLIFGNVFLWHVSDYGDKVIAIIAVTEYINQVRCEAFNYRRLYVSQCLYLHCNCMVGDIYVSVVI